MADRGGANVAGAGEAQPDGINLAEEAAAAAALEDGDPEMIENAGNDIVQRVHRQDRQVVFRCDRVAAQ